MTVGGKRCKNKANLKNCYLHRRSCGVKNKYAKANAKAMESLKDHMAKLQADMIEAKMRTDARANARARESLRDHSENLQTEIIRAKIRAGIPLQTRV
jgi:hypothetical protein